MDRIILILAIVAGSVRAWLATQMYPMSGDPAYSYCYRALLISNGDFSGVLLMWHPPGYPLLLAGLTVLAAHVISPYAWGVIVSIASSVALIYVVDALAAPRVRWRATRIAIASFIVFYEGLMIVATGPLTEPPYVLLLFLAVLLADADSIGVGRAVGIGALLGLACTFRFEALAAFAGLALCLGARQAFTENQARIARGIPVVAGITVGWLLTFGWLLAQWDYVMLCRDAQAGSFTIPSAEGLLANLNRIVACTYHAWVNWLPQVLLLPYWLIVALGLTVWGHARNASRLQCLLLAVVIPCMIGVALTIMHKRTGTFLLPAAAIWFGLGLEFLIRKSRLARLRHGVAIGVALAVSLNIIQATRMFFRWDRVGLIPDPPTYVAGRLLAETGQNPGKTWAFAGEPEVYYFSGQAIHYPFFDREVHYNQLYRRNEGNPRAFVEALRGEGFRYCVFTISRLDSKDSNQRETQPYGYYCGEPLRSDLQQLIDAPEMAGIELAGHGTADRGARDVFLYRIMEKPPTTR